MLWLGLAPSASHALGANGTDAPWDEVCSVAGGRAQTEGAESGKPALPSAWHASHCPLCASAAGVVAPPPAATRVVHVCEGTSVAPSRLAVPSGSRYGWAAARPRGPPEIA